MIFGYSNSARLARSMKHRHIELIFFAPGFSRTLFSACTWYSEWMISVARTSGLHAGDPTEIADGESFGITEHWLLHRIAFLALLLPLCHAARHIFPLFGAALPRAIQCPRCHQTRQRTKMHSSCGKPAPHSSFSASFHCTESPRNKNSTVGSACKYISAVQVKPCVRANAGSLSRSHLSCKKDPPSATLHSSHFTHALHIAVLLLTSMYTKRRESSQRDKRVRFQWPHSTFTRPGKVAPRVTNTLQAPAAR